MKSKFLVFLIVLSLLFSTMVCYAEVDYNNMPYTLLVNDHYYPLTDADILLSTSGFYLKLSTFEKIFGLTVKYKDFTYSISSKEKKLLSFDSSAYHIAKDGLAIYIVDTDGYDDFILLDYLFANLPGFTGSWGKIKNVEGTKLYYFADVLCPDYNVNYACMTKPVTCPDKGWESMAVTKSYINKNMKSSVTWNGTIMTYKDNLGTLTVDLAKGLWLDINKKGMLSQKAYKLVETIMYELYNTEANQMIQIFVSLQQKHENPYYPVSNLVYREVDPWWKVENTKMKYQCDWYYDDNGELNLNIMITDYLFAVRG